MSLTGVVQSPSEGELLECILKIHNGAREVGDRASPMAIADRHCIAHKTTFCEAGGREQKSLGAALQQLTSPRAQQRWPAMRRVP